MPRSGSNGRPGDGQISRITRLELENWRNFRRVDIRTEGRVFLVGPNASGKSNLLDVNRFLHDIVAVGGGFRAAVERRGGVSTVRNLAARRNPDVAIKVTLGGDAGDPVWTYALEFGRTRLGHPRSSVRR